MRAVPRVMEIHAILAGVTMLVGLLIRRAELYSWLDSNPFLVAVSKVIVLNNFVGIVTIPIVVFACIVWGRSRYHRILAVALSACWGTFIFLAADSLFAYVDLD